MSGGAEKLTADRRKVLRAIGENVSRVALALLLGAFIVIAWRFEFKRNRAECKAPIASPLFNRSVCVHGFLYQCPEPLPRRARVALEVVTHTQVGA